MKTLLASLALLFAFQAFAEDSPALTSVKAADKARVAAMQSGDRDKLDAIFSDELRYPTGVGKTTSLAKIAARALMESRQKVALITVDTYRIGASEQITRYGEIMNVPTFVARDRGELGRAIEKCRGADLVLIDSAGRSVSEAVARQAELLRSVEGVSLYLTLSAGSGPRELAAAAERYRALAPASA